LARRDGLVAVNGDNLVAGTHAAAQAQQQVSQLGLGVAAGKLVELVELCGRDLGGLKSLHRGSPTGVTSDVDVTDEPSVRRTPLHSEIDACCPLRPTLHELARSALHIGG
jgi:hypothetical protein